MIPNIIKGEIKHVKWDKMIARICGLSKDLRFDELRKVYVEMVRQVIEREEKKHENVE